MMRKALLALLAVTLLPSLAAAETADIVLTAQEFECVGALLHLGQDHVFLDQKKGTYTPAPGLRRLGLAVTEFDIPIDVLAGLANVRLHDINSLGAQLKLADDAIELIIPFEDEGKEITSSVGSIDLTRFYVRALLKTHTRADGGQILYPVFSEFVANFKGTGLLGTKPALDQARKLFNTSTDAMIKRIFNAPGTQEGLAQGLKTWGEFATGREWKSIVPGSIQLSSGTIRFQVSDRD
jgi:hypothetical protein